jgi:hypothetical protein
VSQKSKQKPSKTSKPRKTSQAKRIDMISLARLGVFRRRPLLAVLVLAVFAAPAGWMMVSAQSANVPAEQLTGEIRQAHQSGTMSKQQIDQARAGAKADSKGSQAKTEAAKKQAAAAAQQKAAASQTQAAASKPRQTTPPAPVPVPAPSPAPNLSGAHSNIITTIFWAGELADASNNFISNSQSAWDEHWGDHFGGFDDPDHRTGYYPAAFTPKENPFYFALPYNDLDARGNRKATASSCPNVTAGAVSRCKNAWIKISKGGKTAYAQWQDVGPLQEDDYNYVFGTAQPANTWGAKAGLDVSPAVRDYLGLGDVDRTSWSFVGAGAVPDGPWKAIVTTSPGGW